MCQNIRHGSGPDKQIGCSTRRIKSTVPAHWPHFPSLEGKIVWWCTLGTIPDVHTPPACKLLGSSRSREQHDNNDDWCIPRPERVRDHTKRTQTGTWERAVARSVGPPVAEAVGRAFQLLGAWFSPGFFSNFDAQGNVYVTCEVLSDGVSWY